MNDEDNQEITNTWEILSTKFNYKTLAQDVIYEYDFIDFKLPSRFSKFTIKYNQSKSDNRTIEGFYKFTNAYA